jgi:hypothetical protein
MDTSENVKQRRIKMTIIDQLNQFNATVSSSSGIQMLELQYLACADEI